MKYTQKTFTMPTASPKVTQAQWERIFGKPTKRPVDKKPK